MKFDAFGNPIPEFGPQDLLRPLGPMNYSGPEAKTINPVVANYLKNKLAPPQSTSAPTQPTSAPTQPVSTSPTQEVLPQDATEETLQDVNPWVKFAAGAGAAIAGRDPNEAISYFDRLRQTELNRLEQNRRQKEDAARRAEDVDFRKQQAASDEDFRQKQLQMQDTQRRDLAAQARADRASAQQQKIGEKQQAKQQSMNEIADRYINIKDSLGNLKNLVSTYGTSKMFGPEEKQMNQYIQSLATDMAKLVDPNSVARETEVESFKKMLFEPGFWQRESSVQGVLDNFGKIVDKRLKSAYEIRGLEQPEQIKKLQSQEQETRVINGKEYIKVPGGWQLRK